jgi:membrane-associated phospholipid phosphatase
MIKGLRIQHTLPAWLRHGLIVISWSIIASTVFVKQHVLLDAAGAVLLVELLFAGTQLLVPLRTKSESKQMAME